MKNYLKKVFKTHKLSAGFTLTELLIAASITSIVVGGAGWGIVNIVGANQTASAQTESRMELNRALDFMAEEVRQASTVNNVSAPVASKPSSSIAMTGTVQSILVLQIPGVAEPVVYHILEPKDSAWLGPRVLYRWGPNLKDDGTYSDPDNSLNWQNRLLVDRITDQTKKDSCGGWTPSPNLGDRKGFYACVDSKRKIAALYLLGNLPNVDNKLIEPQVTSKVFARAFSPGDNNNLIDLTNGVITPAKNVKMNYKVLGGAITCGAGGITLPTTNRVSIDNGKTWKNLSNNEPLSLSAGTTNKVIVQGTLKTTSCGSIDRTYSSTNTTQVKALRDGELVPNVKAFGNQTTIDEYLKDYIDPVTKRISIAGNEVIYLYEMGSTNPSEESFDLQDIVVLASVEPG